MAKEKKGKKKELSGGETLWLSIKEVSGALGLIAFGCVLYYYAEDIGAWFGNLVQEAFNSVFGEPQP